MQKPFSACKAVINHRAGEIDYYDDYIATGGAARGKSVAVCLPLTVPTLHDLASVIFYTRPLDHIVIQ